MNIQSRGGSGAVIVPINTSGRRPDEPDIPDDYITAESDPIGDALQRCFGLVIEPFGMFLCVLGWRQFSIAQTSRTNQILSNIYVALVGVLLVCNYSFNIIYAVVDARTNLLSEYIIQAVLSFSLWCFGLWYFRREEGKAFQEISALIEVVFLRCSDGTTGKLTQTALTNTLRSYLALGSAALVFYLSVALWVAFTYAVDILQQYDPPLWLFSVLSAVVTFGYVAEYAVYICTILIYYICARLLMRYMDWLRDELTRRNIDLPNAEKEIFFIRKLVNDLNVGWAPAMSILSMSFALLALLEHIRLLTALTVLESWQAGTESALTLFFFLVSVYPAMTVTWKGERLKAMAWKIRGELPYRTATRDEIDSFQSFFASAPLQAKLLGFVVYPQAIYTLGIVIFLTVVLLWRMGEYDADAPGDGDPPTPSPTPSL